MSVSFRDQQGWGRFTIAVDEWFGFIPRPYVDTGGNLVRDVGGCGGASPQSLTPTNGYAGILIWNPRVAGVR